nr:transcription factor SPT20 homolog [Dasypus novemcinctus]
MERALELALDRADHAIERAQQRPPERKYLPSGKKSLSQKLYDLYVEECKKEPEATENLRSNVNLLEKLVAKERLPCLVVNLYPGNEGYSLILRGGNEPDSETIRLPYEQGELLQYLDAEELPPVLVDLLEKCHVNMFHSGCVIAEIRDYRQCSDKESPGYRSRHILLRPTMQTLISDVNSITSDNHKWTQEDKLLLESQLILATAEPLCLDPSISVTCTANRLLYNKQKMNTPPMKRNFKRYSWSSLNRQQELSHYPPPPHLRFLTSSPKSKGRKAGQEYDLKISKAGNCVDMWKQSPCNLAIPSEVDVEKYAKVRKYIQSDDSKLPFWSAHDLNNDYGFECEAGSQYQKAKLTVMQSLDDPFISGNIQPCLEDGNSRGSKLSPCPSFTDDHSDGFIMGSKAYGEHGLRQSQELIQKGVGCPPKMSHSSSGSASLSHLSLQKETFLAQSSVSGKGVKRHRSPTKLPSSSGTQSSGYGFTLLQATSSFKSPTPPAAEPSCPSWKSSANLNGVSIPAPAVPSPASSSQRATASQVTVSSAGLNLISVVGLAGGSQALVCGSNPVLSCTSPATTSAGINLSGLPPSEGALPNAAPVAAQPASQGGISLVIKSASNLRPLTVLHLPRGSLILNALPQQPQQLSQATPQQPLQQPTALGPRQPQVQGPQQGSVSPGQALPAQPAAVINVTGVKTCVQSQPAPSSHVGSAQKTPQQSLPSQRFQFFRVLPQQQQQLQQFRIVRLPVGAETEAAAAAPASQPLRRQPPETGGSQSKVTTPKA